MTQTSYDYYDLTIEAKNKAYQQFDDTIEEADREEIDRLFFCRSIATLYTYDINGNRL